ncbi:MAG: TPM domain-containing protein, partial [Desulfofustis sp.]|nr:TPM domain-containing protein [Desulfofustis sp.]
LFITFFCVVFLLCQQIIKRFPPLLRLFLSQRQAEEEVRRSATMSFFTEQLYKTKAENGILLYISVLEQRVWVLGDRGINEKIDRQRWQEIVSLVTDGVKTGHQCEAICAAIVRIGEILEQEFPIEADDKNELHNLIVR